MSNLAIKRIEGSFSQKSIQCFLDDMHDVSAAETAERLHLAVETVYSARKRVKSRMLMYKMLAYDRAARTDFEGYETVIQAAISKLNPSWNSDRFHYDPATQHLTLSGTKLTTLIVPFKDTAPSILTFLPIRTLDISDTRIYSLTHLLGLDLIELDISNTMISSLAVIDQFPNLQHLSLSQDQFTEAEWKDLPDPIQIEFKKRP